MSSLNYDVLFDGVNLATVSGLTVLSNDAYKPPQRKLTIGNIARTDKSKINSAFWEKRVVTISVGITRVNRGQLEQSIDSLMGLLQGFEKDLIVGQSGTYRKYICTLSDAVTKISGGSYAEFDLIFECSDRFGYDLAASALLANFTGYTSAYKSDSFTVGGSAAWQVPVITITYTVITGGTSKIVTIGNDAVGQTISITRTWTAGDVLVIDSYNRTLKVNGIEVDFVGAFPEWAPGLGYWTYLDNFTTRTFTGRIDYVKRWV